MTRLDADERTPFALPRVMSLETAARLGHTRAAVRHQVDRGRWQRLVSGVVLTTPGPARRSDWALAAIELTSPRAALSGWDALRLRGLGAAHPPSDDVLVLDRSGRHRRVGQARIRPTSRPYDAVPVAPLDHELAFVPIVSASRAVSDTAAVYRSLPPVRALVTTAIQRGLCTPEQLTAELDAAPRNWSALLRRSLGDVLDGARSIAEAEAVDLLRKADVPSFELNVPLVDAAGRVVAIADVLWRELRAIAEIDSREFHFDETSWKATSRRHNLLTAAGFAVQHYPPSAIRGGGRVWADGVSAWLRARAAELAMPYVVGTVHRHPGADGPPPMLITPPDLPPHLS